MGYKVKTINKVWSICQGVTTGLGASITYSDGVTDQTVEVFGEVINPHNRTQEEVDVFVKTALQSSIAAKAKALDAAASEAVKMDTVKTTILSDLTKAGLTLALAFMLLLAPVVAWAGNLKPYHDTVTAFSGVSPPASKQAQYIGNIDCSDYYWVDVWANVYESNDNPNAGVSIWYTRVVDTSGTTNMQVPQMFEIDTTTYAANKVTPGHGVTRFVARLEGHYWDISAQAGHASDQWWVVIRYERGRGQY